MHRVLEVDSSEFKSQLRPLYVNMVSDNLSLPQFLDL